MGVYQRLYQSAKAWAQTSKRRAGHLADAVRGSVAVTVALVAVVLIGLVALGVEVTSLFLKQTQMQSAADASAVAGAMALAESSPSGLTVEAKAVAA